MVHIRLDQGPIEMNPAGDFQDCYEQYQRGGDNQGKLHGFSEYPSEQEPSKEARSSVRERRRHMSVSHAPIPAAVVALAARNDLAAHGGSDTRVPRVFAKKPLF